MTSTAPAAPAGQPGRDDLTPPIFRALFDGFDLHTAGATYIVVPAGTLCLAGPSLGDIARQISTRPVPGPPAAGQARPPGKGPGR
jgi:hypothetical protein